MEVHGAAVRALGGVRARLWALGGHPPLRLDRPDERVHLGVRSHEGRVGVGGTKDTRDYGRGGP